MYSTLALRKQAMNVPYGGRDTQIRPSLGKRRVGN